MAALGKAERPSDLDHRRLGAEQDAAYPGITGEPLHGGGGDGAGMLELATGSAVQTHHRLHRGGELEVGSGPAGAGDCPDVEGVGGDFDEGVGEATLEGAGVGRTGGPGQGEDRGLEGGRGDGIEEAAERQGAVLAVDELERLCSALVDVLAEDGGSVVGMAGMGAVHAEATDRVLPSELEEGTLVEGERRDRYGWRRRSPRRAPVAVCSARVASARLHAVGSLGVRSGVGDAASGLASGSVASTRIAAHGSVSRELGARRLGHAGQEGEVGEADLPRIQRAALPATARTAPPR